jgi:hypothetical protein
MDGQRFERRQRLMSRGGTSPLGSNEVNFVIFTKSVLSNAKITL